MGKKATKSVKKGTVAPKASNVKKAASKPEQKKGAVAAVKAVSNLLFGKGKGGAKPAPKAVAKAPSAKLTGAKTTPVAAKALVNSKAVAGPKPAPTKSEPSSVVAVLKKGAPQKVGGKAGGKAAAYYDDGGERMCRESGCENVATTQGYCRLDYVKNWKRIKRKEMILKEGKLNSYIDELITKYPEKHMDVIRQDLASEGSFAKVIRDLELDDAVDDSAYDADSIDNLIGSIRKDAEGIEGGGGDDEF